MSNAVWIGGPRDGERVSLGDPGRGEVHIALEADPEAAPKVGFFRITDDPDVLFASQCFSVPVRKRRRGGFALLWYEKKEITA